jgi:NitT/TauT family transport system ATP-binding protein
VVANALMSPCESTPTLAILVRSLSKAYRARNNVITALSEIDFDVKAREFVSILGPSGCGKSTLLRIVAGLIPHETGQVLVKGRAVQGPSGEIGVVFQTPNLLPWRTVSANLRLGVQIRRLVRPNLAAEIEAMLELLGLSGFGGLYPHELSGGMQQRAALGQILILNPEILLMDEPFGALDALTRDQMNIELMRMWEQKRLTVLFITHSITEALFLSDRIIVLSPRPGRILSNLRIDLPRPRALRDVRGSREFGDYVVQLSELMGVF